MKFNGIAYSEKKQILYKPRETSLHIPTRHTSDSNYGSVFSIEQSTFRFKIKDSPILKFEFDACSLVGSVLLWTFKVMKKCVLTFVQNGFRPFLDLSCSKKSLIRGILLDCAEKVSRRTTSVSNHEGSNGYEILKGSFFLEYLSNRSFSSRVFLCLGHEMNGNWYSWSTGSIPSDYVAGWRHTYNILSKNGLDPTRLQ
jgi:hypothetical protein